MKHIFRLTLAATLLLVFSASDVAAQQLGALQFDVSGVDANTKGAVAEGMRRAGSSGKWSWIDEKTMRGKLSAKTRDCFTASCLKAARAETGVDGGVRVRFSGEAQIYDWTIDVYDLHTGKLAASKKGACELCGLTDVRSQFEASARGVIAAAKVTTKKKVVSTPTPDPKPDPEPDPQPEPEPQPAEPPPLNKPDASSSAADDPLAGLVMVEIVATPADTVITIGDQEIGRGAVTVSLEHGTYDVKFAREGYAGLTERLVIGPQTSNKALLRVHLAKTDPDAVMVRGEGPIDRLGKKRRLYGIGALAGGGVLLGTGIVLSAIDGSPTCGDPADNCPRLYETSALAFATTLTGAFLATSGAVLLAWDALAGKAERQPRKARVVPVIGDGAAGIGIVGRW